MTLLRLADVEAREAAIPPGPWFLDADGGSGVYTEARPSSTSRDVALSYEPEIEAFIAESRTVIPTLTSVVRAMLNLAEQFDRLAARHPLTETGLVESSVAHEIFTIISEHIDLTEGDPT